MTNAIGIGVIIEECAPAPHASPLSPLSAFLRCDSRNGSSLLRFVPLDLARVAHLGVGSRL